VKLPEMPRASLIFFLSNPESFAATSAAAKVPQIDVVWKPRRWNRLSAGIPMRIMTSKPAASAHRTSFPEAPTLSPMRELPDKTRARVDDRFGVGVVIVLAVTEDPVGKGGVLTRDFDFGTDQAASRVLPTAPPFPAPHVRNPSRMRKC